MVWTCGETGEYLMVRKVLVTEVSGMRVRGRPMSILWMNCVKAALSSKRMTAEAVDTARKIGRSEEPMFTCRWLCFSPPLLLGHCVP